MLIAVIAAMLATPSLADAHAVLVKSHPATDAAITPGRHDFRLTFDSVVDARRSRLKLHWPDGHETAIKPSATGRHDVLTAHVERLVPGAYRLDYTVLSVDGHVTRGEIPFTVAGK